MFDANSDVHIFKECTKSDILHDISNFDECLQVKKLHDSIELSIFVLSFIHFVFFNAFIDFDNINYSDSMITQQI